MSLSESGGESPFEGNGPGGHGSDGPDIETEAPGPEFNPFGLRNSQPPVDVQEVGEELDIEAEWWQHLAAGFIKQSGGEGVEAWMHYVMALLLLAHETREEPSQGEDEESNPAADLNQQEAGAAATATYDGPQ